MSGSGKRGDAPKEIVDSFNSHVKSKSDLFSTWLANDGDWLEVTYAVGLRVRTSDSVRQCQRLMTRAEIEAKFSDKRIVDGIIKTKTDRGLFIPSPDCPDEVDARMYKMFDTTLWENLNQNTKDQTLAGGVDGLTPTQAAALAQKMIGNKLPGPFACAKESALTLSLMDEANGEVSKKRTATSKGLAMGANKKMLTFLKTLAKVVEDVAALDLQVDRLATEPKATAFLIMLSESRTQVMAEYEVMRIATTIEKPDSSEIDALNSMKSELDGMLASMKLDVSRVGKMFPDPDAKPKAAPKLKVPKAPPAEGAELQAPKPKRQAKAKAKAEAKAVCGGGSEQPTAGA